MKPGTVVLHSQPGDARRSRWTVEASNGWHVLIRRGSRKIRTTIWAVEAVA